MGISAKRVKKLSPFQSTTFGQVSKLTLHHATCFANMHCRTETETFQKLLLQINLLYQRGDGSASPSAQRASPQSRKPAFARRPGEAAGTPWCRCAHADGWDESPETVRKSSAASGDSSATWTASILAVADW